MHRASILMICMLLGACAGGSLPAVQPSSNGFAAGGSVMQPLEDGKHHLTAGRNGLAIRRFGEELGRHPRSLDALNGMAIAYARIGRSDVANSYFERALRIDPRDPATLNNYGRSLIDQGRFRGARPFLEQALRHAAGDDVLVIAANLLSIHDAAPPDLLTALRTGKESASARQLVRTGVGRYRLRTAVLAASWPRARDAVVDQREVRRSTPSVLLVQPAPRKPRLVGGRGGPVAALVAPATPKLKPVWPGPEAGPGRVVLAAAAPMPAPSEHAMIRAMIEDRITRSDFGDLLEAIMGAPALEVPAPAKHPGEPT